MTGIYHPKDLIQDIEEIRRGTNKRQGVSTGFETLDELMTIDLGYLSIVSGHPSSGKSEFLDAILLNLSLTQEWKALFYSPENFPIATHLRKHVERYVGKSIFAMSQQELRDATDYCQAYFTWMYPENYSLDGLLDTAANQYAKEPFHLMALDPWNEVDHASQGGMRDDQYISKCLTKIRRFNREHNVHTFVVAHPTNPDKNNREADGNYKPPTLNEISGGATWRAKADYGWVAHRHPAENVCKIIVQKIKYKAMGRVGHVSFDYDWHSGRFKAPSQKEYLLPNQIESPF